MADRNIFTAPSTELTVPAGTEVLYITDQLSDLFITLNKIAEFVCGGLDKQIQFNDGGIPGGDADFIWNKTTNIQQIKGSVNSAGLRIVRNYTDENNWDGLELTANVEGSNDIGILARAKGTGSLQNIYFGNLGVGSAEILFYANGVVAFKLHGNGTVDFNFTVFVPNLVVGIDGGGAQSGIFLYNNVDTNSVALWGASNVLRLTNPTDNAYKSLRCLSIKDQNNVKVLGDQSAAVADATGGVVIDSEARTALNSLLAKLRTHGVIAT